MTARHKSALAELTELCLISARDLAARQVAAEDGDEAAKLASALHKVGRSQRQTMALEAKLERDERLEITAGLVEAERIAREPIRRRKAQIYAAVERLIWHEREDQGVELSGKLDSLMDEEDLHDRYATGAVEDHIRRICLVLGLADPRDNILVIQTSQAPAMAQASLNSS